MSVSGIGGGNATLNVLNPGNAPTRSATSAGSESPGSPSGSSTNSVSVYARADGLVTMTITDARGNVVSSSTTTHARPVSSPGSVLDVKA